MVTSCHSKHVGDKLSGDGRTRLVLLVHPSVGEARNDGRYPPRRGTLHGGDEDKKFHEVIVNIAASRLDDENVLVTDGLGNLDIDLSIREVFDGARREGDVQPGQRSICKFEQAQNLSEVQLTAQPRLGRARDGCSLKRLQYLTSLITSSCKTYP